MDGKDPVIVVLISGSGSNLQAIIDSMPSGEGAAKIAAVISNKPGVLGLERANQAGIPSHVIDHREFSQREIFDAKLISQIDQYEPDLIVLAGFMRILTNDFVRRYEGRMLNIHPSLLPLYPGLNTHRRALEANDKEHGVTVHFVTAELDSGPNVIQAKVEVLKQDTPETLATRVQSLEHEIYPIAVKWFVEGRLQMDGQLAMLDEQELPDSGLILDSTTTLH